MHLHSKDTKRKKRAKNAVILGAMVDDESTYNDQPPQRGSKPGRASNVERHREERGKLLMQDYFIEQSVYEDEVFRRRYRMSPYVFDRILNDVLMHDNYFQQRPDATGLLCFTPHQKMTCALRMLAYGASADQCDEYLRMGCSTSIECLKRFCLAIEAVYTRKYLQAPRC